MVGIEGPQMSISIIPVCVRVCVWNRMRRWGGGITLFCEVERDGWWFVGNSVVYARVECRGANVRA